MTSASDDARALAAACRPDRLSKAARDVLAELEARFDALADVLAKIEHTETLVRARFAEHTNGRLRDL